MSEIIGELNKGVRFRGMKLVRKKVSDLKPMENNVKLHPEHQIDGIAKSIKNSGFCDPITVDEYDNIIDGHGRRLALLQLGVEEVNCIVLPMNATVQRAYGIAHNQTTLSSSFDYDLLNKEMTELGITNDDLLMAGFDTDNLRLLDADIEGSKEALKTFKEDNSSWKDEVSQVFRVDLEFYDESDQLVWANFLMKLKSMYPNKETITERLVCFLEDQSAS